MAGWLVESRLRVDSPSFRTERVEKEEEEGLEVLSQSFSYYRDVTLAMRG